MERVLRLGFVLCLIFLSGCAFFNIEKADKETRLSEGEAFIFGRIILSEDGKDLTPYGLLKRPSPTLFRAESGKYSWTTTEKDGSLTWVVPAGTFIVPEVQFGQGFIRPNMAFAAQEPGKAYYIGTVRIDIKASGMFGKAGQIKSVIVADDFESAGSYAIPDELRSRAVKSLMVHDPALPSDLTNRQAITDFLSTFAFPNLRAR